MLSATGCPHEIVYVVSYMLTCVEHVRTKNNAPPPPAFAGVLKNEWELLIKDHGQPQIITPPRPTPPRPIPS